MLLLAAVAEVRVTSLKSTPLLIVPGGTQFFHRGVGDGYFFQTAGAGSIPVRVVGCGSSVAEPQDSPLSLVPGEA